MIQGRGPSVTALVALATVGMKPFLVSFSSSNL
jgi:hypothetical protein